MGGLIQLTCEVYGTMAVGVHELFKSGSMYRVLLAKHSFTLVTYSYVVPRSACRDGGS